MRRTLFGAAALAVVPALYGAVLRPRLLRLGATIEEAERSLPGDGLVEGATAGSTMATTLPAPPEDVWPWLVQMGCNRAGWYSLDRLDNRGVASLDELRPELQELHLGDRLPVTPTGSTWFEVAALDRPRALVLLARTDLLGRRSLEAGAPRPRAVSEGTWAFVLEPVAGGETRLLVRTAGHVRPRVLRVVDLLFWEPAHVLMQLAQFRGLRRRVAPAPAGAERERELALSA